MVIGSAYNRPPLSLKFVLLIVVSSITNIALFCGSKQVKSLILQHVLGKITIKLIAYACIGRTRGHILLTAGHSVLR